MNKDNYIFHTKQWFPVLHVLYLGHNFILCFSLDTAVTFYFNLQDKNLFQRDTKKKKDLLIFFFDFFF